jgi:hypothetical protein
VGSISLTARAGAPGLPEDSDVAVTASITDVRCLPSTVSCGNNNSNRDRDYTAQLLGIGNLRITDRFNANSPGGGGDGATVVDTSVSFKFACANTADPAVGAPCTANTSLNALVPETVKDGKRTVLDLGQLVVYDGGKDGQITAVPDTPDTLFLAQGVFVP